MSDKTYPVPAEWKSRGYVDDAKYRDMYARSLKDSAGRRFINLAGKVDPLTAFACLKRARLFIGNDSGAMHLAAAAGVPTIGLFGPSDERLYAPWGARTRVVRGSRSFDQILAVDPGFTHSLCHMMDLPVKTVVQAANELIKATEPTSG